MNLRENWRLVLLSALLIASSVALFVPLGGGASGGGGGFVDTDTTLDYGLELSGGTRIRAPVVGIHVQQVEGLPTDPGQLRTLESDLAARMNVSLSDVRIDPGDRTIEVFAEEDDADVTAAEFAAALRASGYEFQESDIRDGVTSDTLERMERTLDDKINRGGLSGGDASIARPPSGAEPFILVEVPNADREEVLELIGSRGQVQLVAHFPTQQNSSTVYRDVPLFDQDGIQNVRNAQQGQGSEPPFVPIQLQPEATENFSNAMNQFGFTNEGIGACRYSQNPDDSGYCLYTVRDGNVVFAASMSPGLAEIIRNGDFEGNFQITASNFSEAQRLQLDLQAGALPSNLDVADGTSFFLEPSLAQEFKLFSLITGFVAVLAVSIVVFLRYREPGVAAPMVLTAAAEVFVLLGFASAIGLALDLSHIAGFIAVIGTGVDDLIIIADEILQEGEVSTGRVFESRFRKAFWVIGAAAATTIVALSPLAALSLGDLQGFAIVTIVGVLIGVLVTRPAYGNILRNIVLD
jgi:preprotein translocase subunit SecD